MKDGVVPSPSPGIHVLGSASTRTPPRFDELLLLFVARDEDELPAAEGGGKKGETGGESSRRVSNVSAESLESRRR